MNKVSKTKKIIKFIYLTVFIAVNCGFILTANANAPQPYIEISEKIKSSAVVLIDGDTGQVLFEKNMHEKMYPASITKVMTALIALEKGSLNDTIIMSYDAVYSVGRDTSHIALDENEHLTLEDALYALAISSANDASNGIAELISGSMEDFAQEMTERAKSIGTLKTNFTNSHGLPHTEHYTTAYDMARIMAEAVKIPEFLKIFSSASYDMEPTNRQEEARQFNRKNSLLNGEYKYESVIAEKTGWTPDAGFTFVAAARRVGRTLIAVVMKSPDEIARWEDTTALFEYGFNEFTPMSFKSEEFINKDYVIEGAEGTKIRAELIPSDDFSCFVLKEFAKRDIEVRYVLSNESINGKLHGKAVFMLSPDMAQSMFAELGAVDLQINLLSDENSALDNLNSAALYTQDRETKRRGTVSAVFEIIGLIVVIIIFLFVVLYIRKNVIILIRKKRGFGKNLYRDKY